MRRLLIFVKYPTPGRVKTRLAASVGNRAASEIARACTELTLERLMPFREEAILCVDPPDALTATASWLGSDWSLRPQQGTTLGERLMEATGHAFARGASRVVVMGTDSPWLKPHDLEVAFDVLERSPLTMGPTEDGGYYLIGLSRPAPSLFDGIPWSTTSVYTETMAQASRLGMSVQSLPLGYDLDRAEDVQRFLTEERARSAVGGARRATSRWLDAIAHAIGSAQVNDIRYRASVSDI